MSRTPPRQSDGAGPGGKTRPAPAGASEPNLPDRLLDMEDVARWLATSPRHVQRLVTERRIPFLKVGHFVRFDEKDVASWIEDQKSPDASVRAKPQQAPTQLVGNLGPQSLAPRTTSRQAPSSSQPPAWMRRRTT